MHVRHLTLKDFRSYPEAELGLEPGITTLVGLNGQGKTNLVEAVGYLATLGSHRVATDLPLVRFGADQAIIRGGFKVMPDDVRAALESHPAVAGAAVVSVPLAACAGWASSMRSADRVGVVVTAAASTGDTAVGLAAA